MTRGGLGLTREAQAESQGRNMSKQTGGVKRVNFIRGYKWDTTSSYQRTKFPGSFLPDPKLIMKPAVLNPQRAEVVLDPHSVSHTQNFKILLASVTECLCL